MKLPNESALGLLTMARAVPVSVPSMSELAVHLINLHSNYRIYM